MRNINSTRIIIGLLFIFIGALLLLRLTNINLPFDIPSFLFTWPMILIAFGLFFIISRENRTTGIILLAIGTVFLLKFEFDISMRIIMQYAIPVILLIAGITMLFPRHYHKKKRIFNREISDTDNNFEAVHILSGGTRLIKSENFQGGELVCIFAGTEIYFKETKLSPGVNIINMTCIFGGCEIFVPDEWTIKTETTTILAGIEDKRHKVGADIQPDPDKVLTIKGTLLFAGLEIKRI
jgi:predicted membrane protein